MSVAPRRASISEGPWRYSRHASHARKLARDRRLVARAAARVQGAKRARARGRRGEAREGSAGTEEKKERSFEKGLTTGS